MTSLRQENSQTGGIVNQNKNKFTYILVVLLELTLTCISGSELTAWGPVSVPFAPTDP